MKKFLAMLVVAGFATAAALPVFANPLGGGNASSESSTGAGKADSRGHDGSANGDANRQD